MKWHWHTELHKSNDSFFVRTKYLVLKDYECPDKLFGSSRSLNKSLSLISLPEILFSLEIKSPNIYCFYKIKLKINRFICSLWKFPTHLSYCIYILYIFLAMIPQPWELINCNKLHITSFTPLNIRANSSLIARLRLSISPRRFLLVRKLFSVKNTDSAFRASSISWKYKATKPLLSAAVLWQL